ncbi:hypothetical protein [Nonomuraea typhae]|uniref:NlpC/P60 domain-containing protein n=1 Tax=Nonomuraea typhae TaxID=2603600 RepID=A0ABW7YPN5_9ACTN
MIERAASWLKPPVAYSQEGIHRSEFGNYRTDCSGYVSMAWGLPGKPPSKYGGLDTAGLVEISFEIAVDDLLPGDVLVCAEGTPLTRHITIFERWNGDVGSDYWGFEQAGGVGTVRRSIRYPYETSPTGYIPRRYRRITRLPEERS